MPRLDLLDVAPATLDDAELLAASRSIGALSRRVDAAAAAIAAEIKHRSRAEHGTQGLAQRLGARTAERLVEQTSGVDARKARVLVRAGELLTPDAAPWLGDVGSGVRSGSVSVEKAEAIQSGLGAPTGAVAADDLADAAAALVRLAPSTPVDRLAARAREMRDDLDSAGVADRARLLRDRRYLTLTPMPDGMSRLVGLLDPESAALVQNAYDAATSPLRGGPRFVDPDAPNPVADDRTPVQVALDTFVDLIRIGSESDPTRLIGGRHAVRVVVTATDLARADGIGFVEGQGEGVPVAAIERRICDTGVLPLELDATGRPLRFGRERRLFSGAQRDALAIRDGGCRFPECERPASWCEAHHIVPWSRGGSTDVDDGVLLCRHHHLLMHENGWGIRHDDEHGFVAIPPPTIDPAQTPVPMPSRSRVLRRLVG